ncbi:LuxR C-terminal-related transcriptional regulator [Lysinibacillus pakistanensis]|uniref:LuxR C-terminal-related transcriptional regulator n=1 Tax=Lysinibacillus pakistanensis TaxID=759811 RepID=A0AAX3WVN8_9BACI|nr:LuxR C-terminal-related transcriptional regulator [Lysinibacillus pakistanensis]MDM5231355.1 LuxR C-terminal-related transcriptional regulator [Lysinibacillus pakistanensis]WHY46903.1 LuxR C-terminal-related transcriptional regulator [Lysinibacillus pakistanensis]WHY51916.1 LuxR C-terminal-related transcriptional regulator [Lysinibacillus pakistanensis]
MDMVWVKSKVTIPRTVPNAIERKKLFTILANNRMKKLTIIQAPAGYGKTTLLCHWLRHIDESVAWFTIDRNDNEPRRFFKYLIHTLSVSTLNDLEQKLSNLLDEIPSLETIVDTLLNELDTYKEKIHIVFDNFQVIQHPQIHQIFIRLIEYLPANVRIYITTRTNLELPLANWRVKGWMLEVGIGQLCFDLEELQYLYYNTFSNDEKVGALKPLLKITEGWVAGIQLIKISTGNVDNLNSKEILLKAGPYIHEFFIQEILSSLPSSIQDFLIRTSILNHLEPDVCITITNKVASLATLVDLNQKGLFIECMQIHPPVYRYHTLFKYALQAELKRQYSYEMINSIYCEAATNLCDRGDYVAAIELALNGELYELAHEWIQKYLVEIFAEGHTLSFGQWIQILRNVQYSVDINMLVLYITTLFSMHEIEKAYEIIEELLFKQDASKWMDGFKFIAVSKIFEIINAYVTYMKDGDLEKAKVGLQTQVNVRKEKSSLYHISLKYNQFEPRILRTIAGSKGKFLPIEKIDALIHVLCESEIKDRNITGVTYGLLAEVLYEVNDLARASKELETALQYGLRFQDPGLFIPMYLLKARICLTRKQFEEAHLLLIKAMKETDKPYWIGVLHIMKAQAYLLEGNISYAQQEFFRVTDFINYRIASKNPFYLLVQGRILYAKNQIEEALQIAIRLKEGAIQEKQVVTFIEAGLLEATCHFELEKEESALTVLHDTLEQGALYGYCRTFLEEKYVLPLLHKYWRIRQHNKRHKFNSVPSAYVNKLLQKNYLVDEFLDSFTSREKDVLQLLAEGASNYEIAQQLQLTEGTIRVYLTEIYGKIGVKSRMKAILWAKQWLGY